MRRWLRVRVLGWGCGVRACLLAYCAPTSGCAATPVSGGEEGSPNGHISEDELRAAVAAVMPSVNRDEVTLRGLRKLMENHMQVCVWGGVCVDVLPAGAPPVTAHKLATARTLVAATRLSMAS